MKDKDMILNEYQEQAVKFAEYKDTRYPFLGLAEEVGEVLSLAAKAARGDNLEERFGSYDKITEAYMKELGDCLWMIAACCKELGVHLNDVAEMNIQKLTDRKNRCKIKGFGDNR